MQLEDLLKLNYQNALGHLTKQANPTIPAPAGAGLGAAGRPAVAAAAPPPSAGSAGAAGSGLSGLWQDPLVRHGLLGAGIGAGGAGLLSLLSGDRKRNTLADILLGGLAGAGGGAGLHIAMNGLSGGRQQSLPNILQQEQEVERAQLQNNIQTHYRNSLRQEADRAAGRESTTQTLSRLLNPTANTWANRAINAVEGAAAGYAIPSVANAGGRLARGQFGSAARALTPNAANMRGVGIGALAAPVLGHALDYFSPQARHQMTNSQAALAAMPVPEPAEAAAGGIGGGVAR